MALGMAQVAVQAQGRDMYGYLAGWSSGYPGIAGPGMERPSMHKWYAPRYLAETYARPWYAVDTFYAQETYRRYVDQLLEGDEWYDRFGRSLGRGWLVYSWEQQQSLRSGSQIWKGSADPDEVNAYRVFFSNLVIASDRGGGGSYRLTIGDQIFTRFTPLTLYKPRFDGFRLDWTTDRLATSLVLSRPSNPSGGQRSNATHLFGGYLSFQASDQANLGFTYVNAHNAQTQREFSLGNPLHGTLTTAQNQPLKRFWVRLRDDSPEDNRGGVSLFRHEIVLVDTGGRPLRGRDIGLLPRVEGGRLQDGVLVADGQESILLEYDLSALNYEGIRTAQIRQVITELSVANDYYIEMASDLQTSGERFNPEVIFLPARRAVGNVQDYSNSRVLRLDYGLPTGNALIGVSGDLVNWQGFSLQGEGVLNRRYAKYPDPEEVQFHLVTQQAHAAYLNLLYQHEPWSLFAEVFSIEDGYSTRYWLTQANGEIHYKTSIPELYEFVDDDDDRDALPEWERPFQPSSRQVAWPGYDENGDFLYDYNENNNLIPDYAEPFLRFRADRPEFLFGLDMNYNNIIDRFEDDEQPDYPYKQDHRGFNAYTRIDFTPDLGLVLGAQRLGLISGDGRTRAIYALGTWTRLLAGGGRMRLSDFGALVRDDIPDDVRQWAQPINALGRMQEVPDRLPAQNTWRNTLYGDMEHHLGSGPRLLHRFKWDLWLQRDPEEEVRFREGRKRAGFLGLIDKAEWTLPVGLATLEPRWKSEVQWNRPFSTRQDKAASVEQTATLLWTQPLLAERTRVNYFPGYGRQLFNTQLQLGLELTRLWLLEGRRPDTDQDFTGWTVAAQVTNRTGYQGYQVVSRVGWQWGRRRLAQGEVQPTSMLFTAIYAGLE